MQFFEGFSFKLLFFKIFILFFFFVYMEIKPQLVPIVVMETLIVPLAMCLIL